jgi:hypothetical protein
VHGVEILWYEDRTSDTRQEMGGGLNMAEWGSLGNHWAIPVPEHVHQLLLVIWWGLPEGAKGRT